jgi:hypothetical protein
LAATARTLSVLETFLRESLDAAGGAWDEVEPQVYDVLWPDADEPVRLAFDPEALPEHPDAQLMTFGSPVLDQLLERTHARARVGLAYLDVAPPAAETVAAQVRRELRLPDQAALRLDTGRPRYVTHTVFWFEATYAGDAREQVLYSAAIDRYYGRFARHLESVLDDRRLADGRLWAHPDAPSLPLGRAYEMARDRVLRTVAAEAAGRSRAIRAASGRQSERTVRYFADLRAELRERLEKARGKGDQAESLRLRLEAVDREEAVRLEDLRRKAALRAELRMRNMLHLKAPRLFLAAQIVTGGRGPARAIPLTLTWDPVVGKLDAVACPHCGQPAYEFRLTAHAELRCPGCAGATAARGTCRG